MAGNTGSIKARTHFIVLNEKSLENMGIQLDGWQDIEAIARDLQLALDEEGGKHYTAICKSKRGKMHVHDVVTFAEPKRRNAVAKMFGNAHVEEMRGTKEQAGAYIRKEGKFEEKGEEVLKVWGDPDAIENNAGSRTDLKNFDKLALDPNFNLNGFLLGIRNERDITMYRNRFFRLKKQSAQGFRKVKVIYVEGEAGSGKTKGALDRYPGAFKASVDEKAAFPFDGYQCENTIILDELRPGVFSHAQLMQILDGYKLNINIKGGSAPACWDTVVICTAFPLAKWYDKPFDGCENYKAQLERRISAHYTAHGGKWYKYGGEFSDDNIIAE